MVTARMRIPSVSQTEVDVNSECDTRPSGKIGNLNLQLHVNPLNSAMGSGALKTLRSTNASFCSTYCSTYIVISGLFV